MNSKLTVISNLHPFLFFTLGAYMLLIKRSFA